MTRAVLARSAVLLSMLVLAGCGRGFLPMPTPDALDAWSRTPLPPDQELAREALGTSACRGEEEGVAAPNLLLQDRRTRSTAAFLFLGPDHWGSCLISVGGAGGGSWTNLVPSLAGVFSVDDQGSGTVGERGQATTLGGLAAPEVLGVRVELEDGQPVFASVGSGAWLAWWPSSDRPVRVHALDAGGNVLAVLERPLDTFEWVAPGAAR